MKRLMCFFVIMLLMIPVVGFSDGGVDESEDQEGSSSVCDIKDKDRNSISNPSVAQVISSEEDANYRRCLSDEFASILSDPASEVSALVCKSICKSKGIGKIKNLGCFSGLKKLDLSDNHLYEIDLSANTALTELDLSDNYLYEIDLSANTALTELDLSDNYLYEIDLSANTALTKLDLSVNSLEGIDLSANTALTELDPSDNYLEDVPKGLSNIESKYADINLLDNQFNSKAKEELRTLKKKYVRLRW